MHIGLTGSIFAILIGGVALADEGGGTAGDAPTNPAATAAAPSLPRTLDELIRNATDDKNAAPDEAAAADTDTAVPTELAEGGGTKTYVTGDGDPTTPAVVAEPPTGTEPAAREAVTDEPASTETDEKPPFDASDLPVLDPTLPEKAPDGTVTAPPGPIPEGELPVLDPTLPEKPSDGTVTAPPGPIPAGELPVLDPKLPEQAPDGPVEIPRTELDQPIPVVTETIRLGEGTVEGEANTAPDIGALSAPEVAGTDAPVPAPETSDPASPDADEAVAGVDAPAPATDGPALPPETPRAVADGPAEPSVPAVASGDAPAPLPVPAERTAAPEEAIATQAAPTPPADGTPALAAAESGTATDAPTADATPAIATADPVATPPGGPQPDAAVEGAFEVVNEPAAPPLPTVAPAVLAALERPVLDARFDEATTAPREATDGRRGYLPMPLASPLRLPQQEGPGVVVSPDPVGGVIPASAVSLSIGDAPPQEVQLADFAFGAFQRGLYGTALTVAMQAAARDDPAATALIGRIYEEGWGVSVDSAKAAGWYAVAAELGSVDARSRLARLFLAGRGVPKSVEKAARVFEEAARDGSADAAYALAVMILEAQGRSRDLAEAYRFMRIAAEGGVAEAQYALGVMYAEGQGTIQDDAEATRWFGRAASRGDLSATVEYAIRLFNGVGTAPDEQRAAAFFAEGARNGNVLAMNRLARIIASGRIEGGDEVEAVKWHLLARKAGLSDLYLDGYMGTRAPDVIAEAERRAETFHGG